MAPICRPTSDIVVELEGTNTLRYGCSDFPRAPLVAIPPQHSEQDMLRNLTEDPSPRIAIHNYGQIYICNSDSCRHGRKARLPKEIGGTLARSLSFLKGLRKKASRKDRGERAYNPETSHQPIMQDSVVPPSPALTHELDGHDGSLYPTVAGRLRACPAEMEVYGASSRMVTDFAGGQQATDASSVSAMNISPQSHRQITPESDATPLSSIVSPLSSTWNGTGSDQPSWHRSRYSAVSEITPQTSWTESDCPQTEGALPYYPQLRDLSPTLDTNQPPFPQEVVLDKELSMSPIDDDFDFAVMHEQFVAGAAASSAQTKNAHIPQAVDDRGQSTNLIFAAHLADCHYECARLESLQRFESVNTPAKTLFSHGSMNETGGMMLQHNDIIGKVLDACERNFKDMSSCCPSDIASHLDEIFSQVVTYWLKHYNVTATGDPFTLKDLCSKEPSIQAALMALHVLLTAGSSQEDLEMLQRPTPQQLLSLAFLVFSLLCLAIPSSDELIYAVRLLHYEALSWSTSIEGRSEVAVYEGLVNKFWLPGAAEFYGGSNPTPGPTERQRSSLRAPGGPCGGSGTFLVDVAFMFVRLVASTVTETPCMKTTRNGHIVFDMPPSFDEAMRERLNQSDTDRGQTFTTSLTSIFEQRFSIGGCRSFDELDFCLDQQLQAEGWHDSDLIAIRFKQVVKKAAGLFKGRVAIWLWRNFQQCLSETSQRTVGGNCSMRSPTDHALRPESTSGLTARLVPQSSHHSDGEPSRHEDLMRSCNAGPSIIKDTLVVKRNNKRIKPELHALRPAYPCNQCSKVFYGQWGKGNLRRHKNNTKKHGKKHESCYVCGREDGLVRSDHLTKHMREAHLLSKDPANKGKWIPIPPTMVDEVRDFYSSDIDVNG